MSDLIDNYHKKPPPVVPPPPTASCYICLNGGANLLRNCACQGEASWAHVACLAEFAASQVAEAATNGQLHNVDPDPSEYWTHCNICKTPYMMNMGLAMARACVKHYEHLEDTAYMRFDSLFSMASASEEVGDLDVAMRLYTRLLEICKDMNKEGKLDVREREAEIHHRIGYIFFKQGQLHDAVTELEIAIEINVDTFGPNSPEVQEKEGLLDLLNRGIRKEYRQKVEDTATALVSARKQLEKYSDNDPDKMCCRHGLVCALKADGKPQEAMEQYQELVSDSTRILGSNHPDTLLYKIQAERHRAKMLRLEELCTSPTSTTASQKVNVWAMINCEKKPTMDGQRVKVLRATRLFIRSIRRKIVTLSRLGRRLPCGSNLST